MKMGQPILVDFRNLVELMIDYFYTVLKVITVHNIPKFI